MSSKEIESGWHGLLSEKFHVSPVSSCDSLNESLLPFESGVKLTTTYVPYRIVENCTYIECMRAVLKSTHPAVLYPLVPYLTYVCTVLSAVLERLYLTSVYVVPCIHPP